MFLGKGHKTSPTTNFSGQFLESVSKATFLESGFLAVFSERIISMQLLFRKKKVFAKHPFGGSCHHFFQNPMNHQQHLPAAVPRKNPKGWWIDKSATEPSKARKLEGPGKNSPFWFGATKSCGIQNVLTPDTFLVKKKFPFFRVDVFWGSMDAFQHVFFKHQPPKKLDTFTKGFNRTWLLPKHCFQVDHEG